MPAHHALTTVELSQMPDFLVPNLWPPIKNWKCGSKGATLFCYCTVGLYVFILYNYISFKCSRRQWWRLSLCLSRDTISFYISHLYQQRFVCCTIKLYLHDVDNKRTRAALHKALYRHASMGVDHGGQGGHVAPPDPLVSWRGDTPPHNLLNSHQSTCGPRHASPRIPARSTPMHASREIDDFDAVFVLNLLEYMPIITSV